ncbi:unnamed protein product [Didymodactylos carnosus]|uniref:Uncharacterized protein n=1 Tax=Didymodactylos carnosus TaxID=1234261 RepID=A0A8S2Z001_9BILA|nr:unnamed protein product [Didymodactylos carnosus]
MSYNHISQPQSFHDRPPPPKHLNAKQAANWRRANNKSRYNEELRNSKNPFNCQPWLFDIVFVDYTTTDERLAYLLETTKKCLPSSPTSRFDTIKLIWQNILDRHKVIKGWGNPMLELQSFLTFQMFTPHQIDLPVTNVQNDYTLWNEGRGGVSPFGRDPNFESTGEALQIHAPNDSLLDKTTMDFKSLEC